MPNSVHFDDLPAETKSFLAELRADEIRDLENGLRLVRSVQTVGHFVKWLLVGMLGIAVGAAMLVDSLQKVWMWLSKLGHG